MSGRALWFAAAAVGLILLLGAARYPRFPLDVAATQAIQRINVFGLTWATSMTNTAKPPLVYGLLVVAIGMAWRIAGIRAALLPPVAYVVVLGIDRILKPWVARPRPSPDLIQVVGASSGFGCPSTFALIHGTAIGAVAWLAWRHCRGRSRWAMVSL
ncbi:MAG: hypothetical protein J0L84_10550, partial [Verrucomicrobia bacterium]|nr:hypothetical protein [Verrucomicrobiota bacterium]